jgi:hypothetical protein
MTIENTPAAAPAAAPTSASATPVAAPAPAPAPAAASPEVADPKWLNERIAKAKASAEAATLKALGVQSVDDAKAKIAAAQKAEDDKKTELEKKEERIKALEPSAAEATRLKEMAARLATGALSLLTAEQQAAVKALAGDDAARQLETIEALRPTWGTAAAAAAAAPAAGAAAAGTAAAKPATTAPPAGAPAGTSPAAPHARTVWETTRAQNPFAAAAFGAANPEVYDPKK